MAILVPLPINRPSLSTPYLLTSRMPRRSLSLALTTAFLTFVVLLVPIPLVKPVAAEHHIDLDATMFAFAPQRVRVNVGDTVHITLRSQDVVHGIYIDGYDVNLKAEPGKPSQASFIADRRGKFRFRCSVTCGALHPFMIGELIVGPNDPFGRAVIALVVVAIGTLVTLSNLRSHPQEQA